MIRDHTAILELSVGESDFPRRSVKCLRACRSEFTHRRDLQVKNTETTISDPVPRRSSRDVTQASLTVLPDCCIFCNKTNYKPNSKTREKLPGVQEFRADEMVRKCASLHIQQCTAMSAVAQRVIGVCAKDLICSEAKYHASCYKAFVRIQYTTGNNREDEGSNDHDHDLQPAYDAVYSFCEDLIANPRVIEFKEIRKLLSDEADKLGISVPDSHSKNVMRKMSNMFEELQFVSYKHNKVLVYPITLEMQNAIIENFELNSELKLTSSKSDNEDNVIQVAKLLNGAIKNKQPQMSWPPTEEDLKQTR